MPLEQKLSHLRLMFAGVLSCPPAYEGCYPPTHLQVNTWLMCEVQQLQAWFEGLSHSKAGHWLMSPLISTNLASSITQADGFKACALKTLHYHSLHLSLLRMFPAVQENEAKTCTWAVFLRISPYTLFQLCFQGYLQNKLASGLVTVLCNGFISKAILKHLKEVSS